MKLSSILPYCYLGLLQMFALTLVGQETLPDSSLWSIDLSDVVVTAQYVPTDSRNALHEIKAIKREKIEQRGAINLEQLLNQETNIRIRQDLVLGSSMSLLGIDGQNVKIMIDEVPIIGRQGGNIDLSQLNLQNIERIEIVEGPLSVNYGTNALAGVINLVTKKHQQTKNSIGVYGHYENKGQNIIGLDYGTFIKDKLLIKLNAAWNKSNGYDTDTLRSSIWNPKEQWSFDVSANYHLSKNQSLNYTFSLFKEEIINLGAIRRPQFKPYAFDDYYHTDRINHRLSYKNHFSDKYYWNSIVAYNHFLRKKNSYRTNFEEEIAELVLNQQDTATFNALMLRSTLASQLPNSSINFQVGIDFRYDEAAGKRIQEVASAETDFSSIGDYALFASLRYTGISKLKIETGFRYAHNTRYSAPLIPSLHIKYDLSKDWIIRASYGKGFRSPSLKELFFRFIDINHFIIGNPDLHSEKSDNIQVGFNFHKKINQQKFDLQLKVFYNNISDKITLFEFIENDGQLSPAVNESTGQFAYFNQAIYKTKGINLNLDYQINALQIKAGYSLIAYFNEIHERFSTVSPYTYSNELNGSLNYTFHKPALNLSFFIRKNDQQISYYPDVDDNGAAISRQRIQEGYTLMDFTMNKQIWKKRIKLTMGIRNLLDVQRVNVSGSGSGAHSGGSGSAPIGLGRSYFLSTKFNINW